MKIALWFYIIISSILLFDTFNTPFTCSLYFMMDNILVVGLIVMILAKKDWRNYSVELGAILIQNIALFIVDFIMMGMTFEQYNMMLENPWIARIIILLTLLTILILWTKKKI